MTRTVDGIRVTAQLALEAPGGAVLSVRDVRLEATWAQDQLEEVVLSFKVAPDQWERIDAQGWFNLAPDVRGPTFADGFLPGVDIEIEARLAEHSLVLAAIQADDSFDIGAQLLRARPGHELLQTERWLAMYVKQPRGPIKTGFSTTWAY